MPTYLTALPVTALTDSAAAARVAVQLGQDDAVVGQPVVEGLGGGHRVLADHGVDHEEDVGRVAAPLDLLQLVHQQLVDGEPAGGVEDDGVAARFGGNPLGVLADERRVASRLGVDRHVQLLAQDAELVDGRGAVHVRGHQQGPAAALFQQARQLADGGGLAASLQAHHHDAGGTLLGEPDARVDRPHQLDQFVVAELDEVVLRGHAADSLIAARPHLDDNAERLLLNSLAEVLHHLEADVGLEQGGAHVRQRGVDRAFVKLRQALELLLGGAEPLRECLEHGGRNLAQRSHPQATEVTTGVRMIVVRPGST
jgi:hypothetical protein